MNKYLILFGIGLVVASTVLVFDPDTRNITIDSKGISILYCSLVNTIFEKTLPEEYDTFLEFIEKKYDC